MILIVGAGVFGLTGALELRRRGHEVCVIDPGPIPRAEGSSTDSSRAVRMDYGDDEHHTELARRSLILWREWNELRGEPLFREDGMLFLTREPFGPSSFEGQSFALLGRRGAHVERLDAKTISLRYPMFRRGAFTDGYLSHEAGWTHARDTMAWLANEARSAGVDLREGTDCAALLERNGGVRGVRTSTGELEADHVIVAAGAWTSRLVPDLSSRLRGTAQPMLYIRPPSDPARWRAPHLPVWSADITTTGWYAFPADDEGLVKIGHHGLGRVVDPDAPREVTTEERQRVQGFFEQDVPELAGGEVVRARTCFYTDTSDGDFLIDRHPERAGLTVATGGCGHGFKFAPVLGALVADAALGTPSEEGQRYRWSGREQHRTESSRCSPDPEP